MSEGIEGRDAVTRILRMGGDRTEERRASFWQYGNTAARERERELDDKARVPSRHFQPNSTEETFRQLHVQLQLPNRVRWAVALFDWETFARLQSGGNFK